jgi:hypothetical protein
MLAESIFMKLLPKFTESWILGVNSVIHIPAETFEVPAATEGDTVTISPGIINRHWPVYVVLG